MGWFVLLYIFPLVMTMLLIFMEATDSRGTKNAMTRLEVLKFFSFALIPVVNWLLLFFVLRLAIEESSRYSALRKWFREDF